MSTEEKCFRNVSQGLDNLLLIFFDDIDFFLIVGKYHKRQLDKIITIFY